MSKLAATQQDVEDIYELSPLQQGFLVEYLAQPEAGVYVDQLDVEFEHNIPPAQLRRAWEPILARHSILRTEFYWEGLSEPLQVVRSDVELPLEVHEWWEDGDQEAERRYERLVDRRGKEGFDLQSAPLVQLDLVPGVENGCRILFTAHHLITDGWSTSLLQKEFIENLMALRHGGELNQEPAPSYREYIQWLADRDRHESRKFWRQELQGAEPTPLPDGRSETQSPDGPKQFDAVPRDLPSTLQSQIEDLARELGLSENIVYQAAWAMLMSRYTGTNRVTFGLTLSGRTADLEAMQQRVGMFINTVPVQVRIPADVTLAEWLSELQQKQADIRRHGHCSPAEIQDWADLPGLDAFMEGIFVFVNYPVSELVDNAPDQIGVRNVRTLERTHNPLTFAVKNEQLVVLYESSRFRREMADQAGERYERLLTSFVEHPDRSPVAHRMLSETSHRKLVETWGRGPEVEVPDGTAHRFIERRVDEHPERTAVCSRDLEWTYEQLDARANHIAHHLIEHGAGPDVRVGVSVRRSPELVAALLGVLKAGAAYVALEAGMPEQRLRYMIEDSGVEIILADASGRSVVPADVDAKTLSLEEITEEASEPEAPEVAVEPDHLAYVLYTSGTTGRPKGVMIRHRGLANLAHCYASHIYEIDDRAGETTPRFSVQASYTFDMFVAEVFPPLAAGAQIAVTPPDATQNPGVLFEALEEMEVTDFWATPTTLQLLVESEGIEELPELEVVYTGGEALTEEVFERAVQGKRLRLWNLYGPTEMCVGQTAAPFRPDDGIEGLASIGKPTPNHRVLVGDVHGNPTPIDATGEILIAGPGEARGYIGMPRKTAEVFLPASMSDAPGGRMYATGDLGRWAPNGSIGYQGRKDDQVQLRGVRIELPEIEALLESAPGVAQGAVKAAELEGGRAEALIAYVVPEQGDDLESGELRAYLQQHLQNSIVPSQYVELDEMPRTGSDKLDREALPEVGAQMRRSQRTKPRNEIERTLAAIWCEKLDLDEVGIHENFFEIGGDSIKGLQVVAEAKKEGIYLSAQEVVKHPTIAELSQSVGDEEQVSARQETLVEEAPLTPIQHWFFRQDFEQPDHWNQAHMFELSAGFGPDLVERMFDLLMTHHDALRFHYEKSGDEWTQRYTEPDETSPVELIDVSDASDSERGERIEAEATRLQQQLDIQQGRLVVVGYFDVGEQDADRLLVAVHHLAVDGVSWRILREDVERVSAALQEGAEPQLPRKTTAYGTWAEAAHGYAQSDAVLEHVDYWRDLIEQADTAAIPTDRDRATADNTVQSEQIYQIEWSAAKSEDLFDAAGDVYNLRPEEILLAVLGRVMAEWTDEQAVAVELEGHGREEAAVETPVDLSRTVGWFTTIYPVVLDVGAVSWPEETLKVAKRSVRGVPNNGFDWFAIQQLRDDAPLDGELEPDVVFNHLGEFLDFDDEDRELVMEEAPESPGPPIGEANERPNLLEIVAFRHRGVLSVEWCYSEQVHDRQTIERWAERFNELLDEIREHCRRRDEPESTAVDFQRVPEDEFQALAGQLEGGAVPPETAVASIREPIDDIYELAPLQQGLLAQSLALSEAGVYLVQLDVGFDIPIEPAELRRAWEPIVERHPILRTEFYWEDLAEPLQVVRPEVELPLEEHDWIDASIEEVDQRFDDLLERRRREGLDFQSAPLLKLDLVQEPGGGSRLLFMVHHVLVDGWSTGLLAGEFLNNLRDVRRGNEVTPRPAPSYREYIEWIADRDKESAQEFWRDRLEGVTPTHLDGQGTGERAEAKEFERISAQVPDEVARDVEQLAEQVGVSTPVVFQAAFAMLLARYTDSRETTYGLTLSGRAADLPSMETRVGLFINTVPMRIEISAEDSLSEWMQKLQTEQTDVREFGQWSPAQIQKWAGLPEDTDLMEAIFVYENYPVDEVEDETTDDLGIREVKSIERAHSPLGFVVSEGTLRIRYETSRFVERTVEQMASHYVALLESFVDHPERTPVDCRMLPPAQSQRLTEIWATGPEVEVPDRPVHRMFEEHVEQQPETTALRFDGGEWSYDTLNRRANRLAHRLRELGVGPEVPVGVSVERSPELLAALLGVLKAGGAYVALDPVVPEARLDHIASDAGLEVTVADEVGRELGAEHWSEVCIDVEEAIEAGERDDNLDVDVDGENTAYLLYTSGTTGLPKGVVVPHRALANHTTCFGWRDMEADTTFAFKASYGFDVSVTELFPALVRGACLGIVPAGAQKRPKQLASSLSDLGVTDLMITPTNLDLLLEHGEQGIWKELECVYTAGEALPKEIRKRFFQTTTATLVNRYGVTEMCCGQVGTELESAERERTPIGEPLGNYQVYTLNSLMGPVPANTTGELGIAGAGESRGYQNRPRETALSFVPHPWSSSRGARVYCSGDLASWTVDGQLRYEGRKDDQLQLRGIRVELGEIEEQLREVPGVQHGAVRALDASEGRSTSLTGYFVRRDGHAVDSADIRAQLEEHLQSEVVPETFIEVEAMPRDSSGKIDRESLPDKETTREVTDRVPPRTSIEEKIAESWKQHLELQQVGVHEDFHELGGHSILIAQIQSDLEEKFGMELPTERLADATTIAEWAAVVDDDQTPDEGPDLAAEARLSPNISPADADPGPDAVNFVTGVTGALGGLILSELLQGGELNAVCLVRADDDAHARRRVRSALTQQERWQDDFEERIEVVCGDLSEPKFGLDAEEFDRLAEQTGRVYHCGAIDNHMANYERLKGPNVEGTKEALRLACQGVRSDFFFISTLTLADLSSSDADVFREDDVPAMPDPDASGYIQTKWVSEMLVREATERGLHAQIFRPGMLGVDSKTGLGDSGTHLSRFLETCLDLEMGPDISPWWKWNVVPIDWAARSIVRISEKDETRLRCFHICNDKVLTWKELKGALRELGHELEIVPPEQWAEAAKQRVAETTDHPYEPLLPLFKMALRNDAFSDIERSDDRSGYECSNTLEVLEGASIPSMTVEMIGKHVEFLEQHGHLSG